MISAYIDRMEENFAVLYLGEEMKKLNFPREFLPEGLSEGDYVTIHIDYDKEMTEQAAKEAQELLED